MFLSPGSRLGVYQILSLIGTGGMGAVYRAHDSTLNRDVALKVLLPEVADDADRLARFRREAEILASLNHPNIAHIFGLHESDGVIALVLELVEGETLADRIAHRSIPLEEALPIAKQIAEGLESAHEQGIIHRDLKPANIKLRENGMVKILDFGLAKAIERTSAPSPQPPLVTNSPTLTSPTLMTGVGVLVGTASYMSPEQAKGQPANKGSDIWAFGCVLFELLTARQAFPGDHITEVLASVLRDEPAWSRMPITTPPSVAELLMRCLRKNPRTRLQAIGDARIVLDDVDSVAMRSGIVSKRKRGRSLVLQVAAAAGLLVLGALWGVARRGDAQQMPRMQVELSTPITSNPASFAVSPKGHAIVFSGTENGRNQLWLRFLDNVSVQPLNDTADGTFPFWSPDSQSVGYFAGGKLKILDVQTRAVRELAAAPQPVGGSWNAHGTIVFAPNRASPIMRIEQNGADLRPVTKLVGDQTSHRFPQFLPDGEQFLLQAIEPGGTGGRSYVAHLDGRALRPLLQQDGGGVVYMPPGYLLFGRDGRLMAQSFDPSALTVSGQPRTVAEQIAPVIDPGSAVFSAAGPNLIAYRRQLAGGRRQLTWFDRTGKELGTLGAADRSMARNPSISRDERYIALRRGGGGAESDIWVVDARNGLLRRLTTTGGSHNNPVWSPDGQRLVFSANPRRAGVADLYESAMLSAETVRLLMASNQIKQPEDWSPDGRVLLFRVASRDTQNDIFGLRLDTPGDPFPVVRTQFNEREVQFSTDGRWIAFQSDETGSPEVYVQRFGGAGAKHRVSATGGAQVRWRRDQRELFYIDLDSRLIAVPIELPSDGDDVRVGAPTPLFATKIGGALQGIQRQQYVVGADGTRFLMDVVLDDIGETITAIINFH